MAQLVRAPPCHGGGRGFEPHPGRVHLNIVFNHLLVRNLSSAGRASALQAEGHRFEPCRFHLHADMAQLAEQLICNQQVEGSSPPIGFLVIPNGWIPEWPKGTDCKSAGNAFEGSNPSPPSSRKAVTTRDGAVWKLVGLITRRS